MEMKIYSNLVPNKVNYINVFIFFSLAKFILCMIKISKYSMDFSQIQAHFIVVQLRMTNA